MAKSKSKAEAPEQQWKVTMISLILPNGEETVYDKNIRDVETGISGLRLTFTYTSVTGREYRVSTTQPWTLIEEPA